MTKEQRGNKPISKKGWVVVVVVLIFGVPDPGECVTIFEGFEFDAEAQQFVSYQENRLREKGLVNVRIQEISIQEKTKPLEFPGAKCIVRANITKFHQKWRME